MIHRASPDLRLQEAVLLILGAGASVAAAIPLALHEGGGVDALDLAPAIVLAAAFAGLHVLLTFRGRGEDPVILPVLLLLLGLGMALTQRLAPALAARQMAWIALGLGALTAVITVPIHPDRLRRYRYTIAAIGIGLILLTWPGGRAAVPGGPRLWLGAGPFQFQPAEVLKLLLVIFLAGYLADRGELMAGGRRFGPFRTLPLPVLAPLGIVVGLSLLLLAAQGDLGAALLLVVIAGGMLYLASARADLLTYGLIGFAAGAWWLHRTVAVVRARTTLWLDPWSDPQGAGFQLVQALMAMGAGGVMGSGIGFGRPTAVPAIHTDFVYAAIVEEIGLAGGAAVLTLYGILLVRGLRIAIMGGTRFRTLLAAGLSLAIVAQALIIVGGDVRLIPLTGITLPFISYGGSSMMISCVSAGLLLRLSARS